MLTSTLAGLFVPAVKRPARKSPLCGVPGLGFAAALGALLVADPARAQAPADPPRPFTRVDWNPRPSVRFGDVFRVDFRLKVQSDLRGFSPDQNAENGTYELHRRRAGLEGTILDFIDYQIERELREQGPWRDVFVNVKAGDPFEARAGKFKIPFGLEETTGTMDLDFIHRTRGSDSLTPARSVGAMAHGRVGPLLEYEAGGFRDDGENARLTEPQFRLPGEAAPESSRTVAARVIVTPWRRGGGARPRLGVAFTSNSVPDGLNSLRGRSVFDYEFFPRLYVRGQRLRVGTEAEWSPGSLGVRGEYIRVSERREQQGLGDRDLSDVIGRSWYGSITWVITGERKAGGVQPRSPLFQGGAGAFEVGTRVEGLRFFSASQDGPAFTNPRADHVAPNGEVVWTSGVTWYVNRWVRLYANAIRESFEDVSRTPVPGTRRFWSAVLRTQLVI